MNSRDLLIAHEIAKAVELEREAPVGAPSPIEAASVGAAVRPIGWAGRAADADMECRHGRLPTDPTPPCGCWPGENAAAARRAHDRPLAALTNPTATRRLPR